MLHVHRASYFISLHQIIMTRCSASMAQCYHASMIMAQCYQALICGSMLCTRHQMAVQYYALIKIMAQCCASCIKMAPYGSIICIMHPDSSVLCIMHQNYGSILYTMAQCSASTAHWCASGINVPVQHASIWFNTVHPQLSDVYQASLWHNITIWLSAVQASIYGPMLCIRRHNMAQTCASCINMARCSASSCASRIKMAQYSTTHNTKLTTSCFVYFLFSYFVCGEHLKKGKEKKMTKVVFCLVPSLQPWSWFQAIWTFLLAWAALGNDR